MLLSALEGKCELEAVHWGRQMIKDGSLQLYFSTWPSFPWILVILPLTVDCGDHEYIQPWPLYSPLPFSLIFSLALALSLPLPPLYCNAAGFPSLHFLFSHILRRLCQSGKSRQWADPLWFRMLGDIAEASCQFSLDILLCSRCSILVSNIAFIKFIWEVKLWKHQAHSKNILAMFGMECMYAAVSSCIVVH